MHNRVCILSRNEKGAIGIGAMIVFIAMVLVAGIAASVLVQTSGKLELQAMKSGQETISEVGTGIRVTKIIGHNNLGNFNLLGIEIKSLSGSQEIDLSSTVILISNSTIKSLLTYNSSFFTDTPDINGDLFQSDDYPSDSETFGIIILKDSDGSCTPNNPVMNSGDHILIAINVTAVFGGLDNSIDVFGRIQPEFGSSGVIIFRTPAALNKEVIDLQ